MSDGELLAGFVNEFSRMTVLTGAGCSTHSGIPGYRDDDGNWRTAKPVQFADFLASAATRRRYWARSFAGWQRVSRARPNAAHIALAQFERQGRINQLITQNVDSLHSRAGSRRLIDLHGVLDRVVCLQCTEVYSRDHVQARLQQLNPDWSATISAPAPDGDAHLQQDKFSEFVTPDCIHCGGIIKPDVVFFGEPVPAERVRRAQAALQHADALLIVGSSLMVFSGFRFARMAQSLGKPIAIVNRGRTRADELASIKLTGDIPAVLGQALEYLPDD